MVASLLTSLTFLAERDQAELAGRACLTASFRILLLLLAGGSRAESIARAVVRANRRALLAALNRLARLVNSLSQGQFSVDLINDVLVEFVLLKDLMQVGPGLADLLLSGGAHVTVLMGFDEAVARPRRHCLEALACRQV